MNTFEQQRRSFLCGRRGGYITSIKPVPAQFSAGDSHGKFVVEEDRNGEL
jgi:rRNA maturation protein Nop10